MQQPDPNSEQPCYELEGYIVLQSTLADLCRLLKGWVRSQARRRALSKAGNHTEYGRGR